MDEQVQLRERVKVPPAPEMVRAYHAPNVARDLEHGFADETYVHLAHALMLVRQGILSRADGRAIVGAVLDLRRQGPELLGIDYTLEDLYSYVERYLVRRLGPDVGGRLHTGRSRNDLHVTTWRMALRGKLQVNLEGLCGLRAELLDLAERHVETVMPGYTHSQHAQPVTLGYYCLAFADVLARDHRRLVGAYECGNQSPLGAAALTTTGFPIDRSTTAAALGFDGLVEVAYDAVSSRDDALEGAAALAVLGTNLSRLAFDLQAWNTMEYGFVELADAYAAVSSIMPQKKNPHPLEHCKGASAKVIGALVAVLAAAKNTSYSDVNDGVSSINEPVLDAAGRMALLLPLLRGVLRTLTVHPDRMAHYAAIGYGTATELADVIVREKGLSFRVAHNIVGHAVREALARGKVATEITAAMLDASSQALFARPLGLPEEAVAGALDPARNVAVRRVAGGPAADEVRRMLAARRTSLAEDEAAVGRRRARVESALAALVAEAEALAAS